MFNSFTWENFITTTACIVGGYYAITTILLYHKEIVQWLRPRSGSTESFTLQPEHSATETQDVMGTSTDEQGQHVERASVIESDEVVVEATDEIPDTIRPPASTQSDVLLIGSVADLLNEIKALIQHVAEYRTEKDECAKLFKASLLKYPHLKGTPYQLAITDFICEESKTRFPFMLTMPEVQQWWD
jgi:hypothetical protein